MIKLIKPYITFDEIKNEFEEIFDSGMLTRGKYSAEFPQKMCEYTGVKHSFNATSATTALAASLDVLGIGQGDEVIVSDFSFPATVNVVEACGATPVFADVSRGTYNMLPDELEKKITPKTKAVIFVCALGNPSGLDKISDICKTKRIPLIDDAACAIGSSVNGMKVGNLADLECFSFHPRKLLTAGEGGAITTNNDQYAEYLSVKLAHGAVSRNGKMDFVTYGYNYRLPELQCLMLIKQLAKLDEIVAERVAIQKTVAQGISDRGYIAQKCAPNAVHNIQSLVFTVPEDVDRDGLIAHLKENGIESTIGTYCLSNCTYYKKKYNDVQPNALYLEQNTITLPCYTGVDTEKIVGSLLER
ncbi:MAG: DegT/DnrJ/EryC1/StrS family aminotransferase [Christensenella sp.]|nr:DegT/DnrJ/EryC1/StrS family aminotransferase [Christensenella sp.]